MTRNVIEYGFYSRDGDLITLANPHLNPFVVVKQCIELVVAIIPFVQGNALQTMLREEAEPCDPMRADKKEDNRKPV